MAGQILLQRHHSEQWFFSLTLLTPQLIWRQRCVIITWQCPTKKRLYLMVCKNNDILFLLFSLPWCFSRMKLVRRDKSDKRLVNRDWLTGSEPAQVFLKHSLTWYLLSGQINLQHLLCLPYFLHPSRYNQVALNRSFLDVSPCFVSPSSIFTLLLFKK